MDKPSGSGTNDSIEHLMQAGVGLSAASSCSHSLDWQKNSTVASIVKQWP